MKHWWRWMMSSLWQSRASTNIKVSPSLVQPPSHNPFNLAATGELVDSIGSSHIIWFHYLNDVSAARCGIWSPGLLRVWVSELAKHHLEQFFGFIMACQINVWGNCIRAKSQQALRTLLKPMSMVKLVWCWLNKDHRWVNLDFKSMTSGSWQLREATLKVRKRKGFLTVVSNINYIMRTYWCR